jgi:hypothetical protein
VKGNLKIIQSKRSSADMDLKSGKSKRIAWAGGGMAQVVEHLPSKHKALSSNTSSAKKRKKRF